VLFCIGGNMISDFKEWQKKAKDNVAKIRSYL
jgi:hypothetical protein